MTVTTCVGMCKLDDKKVCTGCHRTIQEIREAYEKNTTKQQ